jgi:hypothetical protein
MRSGSLLRFAAPIALAAVAAAPLPALAKDVCLTENVGGGTFVLQKVKKMKLNRAVPITGIYVADAPDETFPLQGVAVLLASGNLEVGVTVHSMARNIFAGPIRFYSMQVDPTFQGTGGVDETGDGVIDSANYAWAATDCKAVVIP